MIPCRVDCFVEESEEQEGEYRGCLFGVGGIGVLGVMKIDNRWMSS